nr:hypothetical protein [uncultured Fusobacterium sp.]
MKEILKSIKLGQIIGIYHFEDSCFTVGKILKISSEYLFLLSYNINFKEDGIKVFLINSIKRIILKSDYIHNEDYLIFSEKGEFYDDSKINIISKNIIKNISDLEVKLNIKRENFYNNLEKGLEILEILKKCYENKFLIFIDNEEFFETKIGIIIELEDEKLKMKEIDKYGNFNKISEVYFDEIQLLAVKNYKFMEEK